MPPRIVARKASLDLTKAPATAAETIGDPAQTVKAPLTSSTNAASGAVKTSSAQGDVTPSGSTPLADDRETDDRVTFRSEDLVHAGRSTSRRESDQERRHQNPTSSGRASAAAEGIAAALGEGIEAHRDAMAPGSTREDQEGQRSKSSQNENVAQPTTRDDDVQRQAPTTNTVVRGETSAQSSANEAGETHSVSPATKTTECVDIHDENAGERGVDLSIERAPPSSEGNRGFACDDGRDGGDPDNNRTSVANDGHPLTLVPNGELSVCADSEGGRLRQACEAAGAVEGEPKQTQTNEKPPSGAASTIQEGEYRPHLSHAQPTNGDVVSDSDNPRQDGITGLGSRRRSSGKRETAEERGRVRSAGSGEVGGEGDPHALRIDPEREAEGVVQKGRLPSSSGNQELLRSPPMLSRRRPSGRASESLMGSNNTVRLC